MLLVIGWAFFTGGIIHCKKVQVFNKQHAQVNVRLLLMALMGIMLPAVLHFTHSEVHFGKSELSLSRFSSCVMLVAYAIFLFFKFISHHHLYRLIDEDEDEGASASLNIPVAFISAILFPVVGNIWSIMFSMSEKLDLTLGVPIGLSTQTAMFSDGKSNCFIGLIFIMCYLIIAASFYGRWLIYYWCRQCSLASLLVCCVGTLNHRDLSTKNLHDQLL
ncbi:hypothetical protein ACLB2K_062537 [Fragaria x ananassa]